MYNEHKLKYIDNAYSKTGTLMKDTSLEAMLMHCTKLPKTGKKGQYGAVFVYNSDKLGVHKEDETSTGVILLDIDYISKEIADAIYNNFDILVENWNSLLAIQFSSSYYTNNDKNGLHIYVKSRKLNKYEYKMQAQLCLAVFAQLVLKHLDIDLLSMSTKEKPVLDFHNTNLYQRFNLFYSTFKYNDDANEFSSEIISFEDFDKLANKYNLTFDSEINTYNICPTLNGIAYGYEREKINVGRNLHIGKYSGNDIRFRISIIADILFGENAKEFCDKYFYCENHKSIYTHYTGKDTFINPLIYKWLVENKYIIENSQNLIDNWIDEYSDKIVKEIKDNKKLEIVAPTGTGKTTYINNFLAQYMNSVVIVPFNVTNKLYSNLFEVNASYNGKIPTNKPIVMIWDQAIKHWEIIKDRHIIVDEAHTLFFDRNYRDSAVKLILKLKEENTWVTFITATPAGEKDLFGMKQIQLYKKRDLITLNVKATKSIEWAQYNYIKKCLEEGWYDKIILLDDTSAKKIYERFVIDCYGEDISYIRSSTKESQDFINLRENEILYKKLTICTCVAFNGLNFKNDNENILVVGSIQQGNTTSCEIIQQIGRIRKSKVTGVYFYDPDKYYNDDIDEKVTKAKEMNELVANGAPDTFLSYDRKYLNEDYVDALKEIQTYQSTHSNINKIRAELGYTGYITGYIETKSNDNDKIRMNLALKKQESDEMKNDILNGLFLEKEYEKEYQKKWAQDINYMISNPFYSGITIDTFIDMFNKQLKHKLVETSINNLKDIIRILQVDELEYNKFIENIGLYASKLSNEVSKKQFISNSKRIKDIREKYMDKIKFNNGCIELDDIVKDVIQYECDNMKREIESGKIGGKISSPKKKIQDLETGIIYDSCNACANDIGYSITYISKHKNRFIKIKD